MIKTFQCHSTSGANDILWQHFKNTNTVKLLIKCVYDVASDFASINEYIL